MKKKKGFTMIELLAVVVILGIIGTIGVVGVTRIIKSSHERHNLAQAKLFISGAQMYFTDNKSKLPTKTFTSKEVTLKELQEQNYVEKIVDYKKEEYDANKSYAYVTKMGTGKYAYDGELITQDGERTKYKPNKNDNSVVAFYIGNQNFTNKTAYTNAKNTKEVRVQIKDPDTIAGYIITLYKGEKELRQLEYKEIGNKKELETKITIRPEEYPDGHYKIQVKVIDIYNNQKTAKSGTLVVDTIAPKCTVQIKSGTKGKNNWYISNVNTVAKCEDRDEKRTKKNVSGCSDKILLTTTGATSNVKDHPVGEWEVKKDGKSYLTYTVKDQAGNETVCKTTEVKKDEENPTCQLKIKASEKPNKAGWYRENVDIVFSKKEDNISGVKNYGLIESKIDSKNINFNNMEYRITQKETKGTKWYGYVEDEAGNVGQCDTGSEVKVDTTAPNCSVDGESTTWTKDDRNITYVCNDGTSGCATPPKDTLFTTTAKEGWLDEYNVTDKAGNMTTCSSKKVNVYIDKKVPKVTISGNKASSWYSAKVHKENFRLSVTISNVGPSGATLYGKYDCDAEWSKPLHIAQSSSEVYQTQEFGGIERNNDRIYKAKSGAGLEGSAQVPIKIDNTAPVLKIEELYDGEQIKQSGCKDGNSFCKLDYENQYGAHLTATDKGGSGVNEWGAIAKYSRDGNCHWGEMDYQWSGEPVCKPIGKENVKRCYRVKDKAQNISNRVCICQKPKSINNKIYKVTNPEKECF